MNEPLAVAYFLKEDLRQIWSQPDKHTARRVLRELAGPETVLRASGCWCSSRPPWKSIKRVLNYYRYPISTGPLEGTNNKIKTMKRQAYGFRDHAFFKLKILGIHETKHALVG